MSKWATLILLITTMMFVAGCSIDDFKSDNPYIAITAESDIDTNGQTVLVAKSTSDAPVTWVASGGILPKTAGSTVTWIAPSIPGAYIITAKATINGKEITASKDIVVNVTPMNLSSKSVVAGDNGTQTISTTFRNDSGKQIQEFYFHLLLWDSDGNYLSYYDDGLDTALDFHIRNTNTGSDPYKIEPDATYTHTWATSKTFNANNVTAWVYKIVYSDGTTWELK